MARVSSIPARGNPRLLQFIKLRMQIAETFSCLLTEPPYHTRTPAQHARCYVLYQRVSCVRCMQLVAVTTRHPADSADCTSAIQKHNALPSAGLVSRTLNEQHCAIVLIMNTFSRQAGSVLLGVHKFRNGIHDISNSVNPKVSHKCIVRTGV